MFASAPRSPNLPGRAPRRGIVRLLLLTLVGSGGAIRGAPPAVTHLFPSGARRGQTVEVSALGTFSRWPPRVWVSEPGLEVEPAKEKGKLTVRVKPTARLGRHWLRFHDEEGASALRPFVVGALREVLEREPNDRPREAQPLGGSRVVVDGRLDRREDVDGFAVYLRRGETLVGSVEAHRELGSPMDGVLQVVTPGGFVEAQNDDDRGLDPRLVWSAPREGIFVVRIFAFPATPNSSIRLASGDHYVYRLTLTTGPFADYPFPLVIEREKSSAVTLQGWNLPEDLRTLTVTAEEAAKRSVLLEIPGLPAAVRLGTVPYPSLTEDEVRRGSETPTLPLPSSLSGRVARRGEADTYHFEARKGESISLRVRSRSLGFPLDPVVQLLGVDGKLVAESDDRSRTDLDPVITKSLPVDGVYRVRITDRYGHGSSRHAYRLDLTRSTPDYSLRVSPDRFVLRQGATLEIAVQVERRGGFAGDVEISAEGLPPGVEGEVATSTSSGESAKKVTVKLRARKGAPLSGVMRLVGRSAGDRGIPRTCAAPVDGLEAVTEDLWLSVLPPKAEASK